MLDHIRIATEEEVEKIKDGSDLGGLYSVFAYDHKGGEKDIAVVKTVVEVDPVFYAEGLSAAHKARFIWGLEERLLGAGIVHYYFNVPVDLKDYIKIVKEWGAVQQSKGPELRFGRSLLNVHPKD